MDDFNPYEELGLNNSADQNNIRSAYKRLALRFHPDKPEGDELKFKRIHQAYQILNDPFKKSMYDNKHHNVENAENNKILEEFLANMVSVLHDNLKAKLNSKINNAETTAPKKDVMNIELDVDIRDVYYGEIKKVIIKVHEHGKERTKPFYISLIDYQDVYCFEGEGDDGKDINIKLNIVSKLFPNIQQDTVLSKYNLNIEQSISPYEYYYGVQRNIQFFDEDITIKLAPFANHNENMIHIINNKGLPYINENEDEQRGDIYIHFTVVFPNIEKYYLETYEPVLKTLFQCKNE